MSSLKEGGPVKRTAAIYYFDKFDFQLMSELYVLIY